MHAWEQRVEMVVRVDREGAGEFGGYWRLGCVYVRAMVG